MKRGRVNAPNAEPTWAPEPPKKPVFGEHKLCHWCKGSGKRARKICGFCSGSGFEQ